MRKDTERRLDWMGLPVIATVARLLCWELTLQNEYLRVENRILKEKAEAKGRLRFTDEDRRSLMEAALAMGRSLMDEVVNIVKPETVLAWQRRLEREKWDFSARRRRRGRPRTPSEIEALVCRLARENSWGYQRICGELLIARNVLMDCDDLAIKPRLILHDRDLLLTHDFDHALTAAGLEVIKTVEESTMHSLNPL